MDTVIPFDFEPLFKIITRTVFLASKHDEWENHELFVIAYEFICGKRGNVIDKEVGNALFTVVDNLARIELRSHHGPDPHKMKVFSEFCDYLKLQGIKLKSY